jgi:hypothetical protein
LPSCSTKTTKMICSSPSSCNSSRNWALRLFCLCFQCSMSSCDQKHRATNSKPVQMLGLNLEKQGYDRWTCDAHTGNQSCNAPMWNIE